MILYAVSLCFRAVQACGFHPDASKEFLTMDPDYARQSKGIVLYGFDLFGTLRLI
jgi:leucyl-tRNA synthetase